MSELSTSNSHFSSLLISDLIRFFSFILSHPLYFSYFIFFSPYFLKLFSFLSPLFITTLIVFLAFLAGIESQQTRFVSIVRRLQFEKDASNEEIPLSDHLGIYETVFGLEDEECGFSDIAAADSFDENKVSVKPANPCVVMEEKRLENFFKILDEFERLASNVEDMKKKISPPPPTAAAAKSVVEKQINYDKNNNIKEDSAKSPNLITTTDITISDSDPKKKIAPPPKSDKVVECHIDYDKNNNITEDSAKSPNLTTTTDITNSDSHRAAADDVALSSYGSMRREREWERTLAGKLFEERRSGTADAAAGGGGGEGMDSLWEAYEMEEFCKAGRRRKEKVRTEKCRGRKWEEEDEEEEIGGQLCCLQALKLSAGKVVLGMGKPNLVKITKAIKGIGWLHKTTKNSKKVHHHRF